MKINKYNEMMRHVKRKPETLSKTEKKKIVDDFYEPKPKPMPILSYIKKINSLYGNGDDPEKDPKYIGPTEMEDIKKSLPVSPMVKKLKKKKEPGWKYTSWADGQKDIEEMKTKDIIEKDFFLKKLPKNKKISGIKDSSIYKLLSNPKVIGTELGHDAIIEIINLLQNSGIAKKPKPITAGEVIDAMPADFPWELFEEEEPKPIAKKPRPTIQEQLDFQDHLNTLDPIWWLDEDGNPIEPKAKAMVRKPRRTAQGIQTILNLYRKKNT